LPLPTVTHGNILPHPPPPIAISPVNMQTLFASIALIDDRLEKLGNILSDKLPKLDVLDTMNKKLDNFERTINYMKNEIDQMKNKQQQQERTISKEEVLHHNIEDRVRELERHNQYLETENKNLREDFLRLKTHSMKYNLIFGGIEQTQEYEEALVNFMQTELGIDDANSINLQNVHRLSRRNDGKPQNIIARFVNYSHHEGVLKEVPKALIKQTTIFNQPTVSDRNWRSS
jgi:chromosome segregation ATPase